MRSGVRAILIVLVAASACRNAPHPLSAPAAPVFNRDETLEPIKPLPVETPALDPRYVALGERLFADPRLSADGSVSCASCHSLDRAAADSVPRSKGAGGTQTQLNAPSLFNLVYSTRSGWHGGTDSIEEEIDTEIAAPDRMGSSLPAILAKIRANENDVKEFGNAFPDGVTAANVTCVLADYVRSLTSPNSKFDKWLRGDRAAMTWPDGELGYVEFKSFGCASCHQGVNAGGNLMVKLDLAHDADEDETAPDDGATDPDLGRWLDTKELDDRYVFRVPSLRNIACTAPYFHDGSAKTLEEAISQEAIRQVGHRLNKEQVDDVARFLRNLTGEYRGKPL